MAASKVFIVAVAIMLLGFYLAAKAETGTVGNESGETEEMKSLLSLRLSSRILLPKITSKKLFQNGCDGNPCSNFSCYYLLNGCTCNRDTDQCIKEAVPPPAEYDDTFEEPDIVNDQDGEIDQEIDGQPEEIDQEFDSQGPIDGIRKTECWANDCIDDGSGYGSCVYTKKWNLDCRCIRSTNECGLPSITKPKRIDQSVPPPAEYDDTFEEPDIVNDQDGAIRSRPPNWNTDCSVNDCQYDNGFGNCDHTREWNLICRCQSRTGKCIRYTKPKKKNN